MEMNTKYKIENLILGMDEKNKYYVGIKGWFFSLRNINVELVLSIDKKESLIKLDKIERKDIKKSYKNANIDCGFEGRVYIDGVANNIAIYLQNGKARSLIKKITMDTLIKNTIQYNIDLISYKKGVVKAEGWAVSTINSKITIRTNISNVNIAIVRRVDVVTFFKEFDIKDNDLGFKFKLKAHFFNKVEITFTDGDYSKSYKIDLMKIKVVKFVKLLKKLLVMVSKLNIKIIKNKIRYIRTYGFASFINSLKNNDNNSIIYDNWIKHKLPDKSQLDLERNRKFDYMPKVSIVVPLFNTTEIYLKGMIDSVLMQSYENWELCLSNGSPENMLLINILDPYLEKDKRIKYALSKTNLGISDNTNAAIKLASGDYIGLLDHDDVLTFNALYQVVEALNEKNKPDLIYSDEDKMREKGKEYFDPFFKPDFSPDMLRSYNYICHFLVFSKKLLEKVGTFNRECDGSQDYDMILRLTEIATNIYHLPKILYHWRVNENSTAGGVGVKEYAMAAAKKALEDHLTRLGLTGDVKDGLFPSSYKIDYEVKDNPKVSIIILNKDNKETLENCINSIYDKTTYDNFEIIIVENSSKDIEIFSYYSQLKEKIGTKIIKWKGEFNFSAINNFAVKSAEGEYLILLNNDTEIITPNWIEEMLMFAQRDEVGIVGVKLYYPDDTIQHAGIILGIGGVAGHSHKYFGREEYGHVGRLKVVQNLSAVTAACMMVRKAVYEKVKGLDENFKVAFNDVDFCLKVRELNKLIVFTPYAELYHYESRTRGAEDSREKINRFNTEINRFEEKWGLYIEDPYYNVNLSKEKENFSIEDDF